MEYKAVTFNMPGELHSHLKVFVGPKKMSQFVTQAVREKLEKEELSLRSAYRSAAKDIERVKECAEWDSLDGEGWE